MVDIYILVTGYIYFISCYTS